MSEQDDMDQMLAWMDSNDTERFSRLLGGKTVRSVEFTSLRGSVSGGPGGGSHRLILQFECGSQMTVEATRRGRDGGQVYGLHIQIKDADGKHLQ